ncbi:MAG: hypothetical protein IH934_06210 [Nanoarchaeota archaeon]|nr:hypothetical protein [Nanoarchaeota archaeon]
MRLKRGMIGLQFNWIFILVSGAIVLVLITGIVMKQSSISKISTNALILRNLDDVLSSSEISTGTVNVVKIPKSKIEFECNRFSIDGISKQINGMNVFAPSVLEGDSIISMTLGWSIPFKVTNFVYLTNPRIRYVLVGDNFAKDIHDSLPSEISKDYYNNFNDIKNKNDEEVRIVFFGQVPEFPSSLEGAKVTALKVSGDENKGSVEFFDVEDNKFVNKGISYYIRESTLLGAVFSGDIEIYECVMENVFEKLNVVSQVYERKTDNLRLFYKDQQCEQFYDPGSIETIKESSVIFSQSSINNIDINAKNLKLQNKQSQLFSCPLIY